MKRHQLILLLLLAVWSVGVGAQQAPATYRVEVVVHPGDDEAAVAKGLAATYGGRLESPIDADHTVVMTLDDAVLTLIERDPRVVSVQRNADPSAAAMPPALTPDGPMPQARIGTVRMQTDSTATPWTTGTYKYDAAGNIIEIGDDRFVYDVYSRVKSGTAGAGTAAALSQTYAYDSYGNVTSIVTGSTTIPLTVNTDTNRLTSVNGSSVSYDAAGQVLQAGTSSYAYDGSGMMISSQVTGAPPTLYIYTASDERIASVLLDGGGIEVSSSWSFRDASGKVLRRLDKRKESGQWTWVWREDYVYNGSQMLASENDTVPKTRHYFTDHLGSPRLITDNGGMRVGLAAYLPFGAPALASGVIDAQKFTGHERDASGLDYMLARYYNWGWGRFLSVDPSVSSMDPASPQSWNRYTYAMNNPLKFIDPDGAQSVPTTPVTQIVGKYMFHFDPTHAHDIAKGWHIDVSVKRGGQWTKIGRLVPGEEGLRSLAHLGKSEEVPKAALKALLKKQESFSPKARAVLTAMLEECESLAAAKAAAKTAGKVLTKIALPLAIITEIFFMEQANASDDTEAIAEANVISLIMFGKPISRLDGNQLRQLWVELAGGRKLGEGAK